MCSMDEMKLNLKMKKNIHLQPLYQVNDKTCGEWREIPFKVSDTNSKFN